MAIMKMALGRTNILLAVAISSLLVLQASSPAIGPANAQPTHDFYIWSNSGQVTLGWYVKIEGRICPTPLPLDAGTVAIYTIIKPDGSLITTSEKNADYSCGQNTLIQYFKPDTAGTWSVSAVYKWISSGGSQQQIQSNLLNFEVK